MLKKAKKKSIKRPTITKKEKIIIHEDEKQKEKEKEKESGPTPQPTLSNIGNKEEEIFIKGQKKENTIKDIKYKENECENEKIARAVAECLNEEKLINKENILEL